jgi:hypothetical protein
MADEEEFTEDIPYTETRNYVKRVLGSYQRYAVLYGTKRVESREPRAEKRSSGSRAPNAESRVPSTEGSKSGRR